MLGSRGRARFAGQGSARGGRARFAEQDHAPPLTPQRLSPPGSPWAGFRVSAAAIESAAAASALGSQRIRRTARRLRRMWCGSMKVVRPDGYPAHPVPQCRSIAAPPCRSAVLPPTRTSSLGSHRIHRTVRLLRRMWWGSMKRVRPDGASHGSHRCARGPLRGSAQAPRSLRSDSGCVEPSSAPCT